MSCEVSYPKFIWVNFYRFQLERETVFSTIIFALRMIFKVGELSKTDIIANNEYQLAIPIVIIF